MSSLPYSLTEAALHAAEEIDIKIEMVDGIPVWEVMPSPRHQQAIDRIRNSIQRSSSRIHDCGSFHYSDMAIRFEDGSFKRPDVSIYCSPVDPSDEATDRLPAAIVEVLSKGYEAKDLVIGLPFYQKIGIMDVIILDPRTSRVIHARKDGQIDLVSPTTIDLECGCAVTV